MRLLGWELFVFSDGMCLHCSSVDTVTAHVASSLASSSWELAEAWTQAVSGGGGGEQRCRGGKSSQGLVLLVGGSCVSKELQLRLPGYQAPEAGAWAGLVKRGLWTPGFSWGGQWSSWPRRKHGQRSRLVEQGNLVLVVLCLRCWWDRSR